MLRPLTVSVLVAGLFASATVTLAQAPRPTLTVGAQIATFADAVALFDEGQARVSVLFPRVALSPDVEAAARATGSWAEAAATVAPAVIADLAYTPGSTSGMVAQLKSCRLTAVGFKTPWQLTGSADQCHVISIGGFLKSGGGIAGLLEGKGSGYALRLPFALALMEAAATSAAPPPSAVTPAAPPVPLGTVTGVATYLGQTITLTHAIAWWAEKQGQVRVALFDHAPPAGILTDLRAGSWGDGGPVAQFHVGFADGPARDLSGVDYCFVNVTFPKGGPMGINTRAAGCGLTVLSTDARPGGHIVAVLKNSTRGPAADYTWDLTLHVPIAK
jgi:hypothetical protein